MATYTSSQSGNFSSSTTWGGAGVPADGDTFNVSVGHTVTIDTGISIPANGYNNSFIYGILQSQASVNTTLRMNGILYIKGGGLLHLRDGAKIQINGSSAETHGVWQENENGASVIMEGSDGMPSTTLSSNTNEGSTSLTVASAAAFGIGEWIAVFNNTTAVGATNDHVHQHQDEGFWIHDISSNVIYFRIFGGPQDVSITSFAGSTITVTNAKVFRVGQKIIFGTGVNRNIKTITSINYQTNVITCDSSISGTVTGQFVYLTGTEKYHNSSSKVRKIATVTTAASSSAATTITVANANMFTAGDEIWIEWRGEADSSTDYVGNYDSIGNTSKTKRVVSSVSGNTITLNAAISYNVVQGALVTRMTRKIVIETVATDGSDYGYFYDEYLTDYNRKLILKDVYFKNVGSINNSVFQGCVIRGYHSTNSLPVTISQTVPSREREPWIEGLVVECYPDNNHRRDWAALWLYDARYAKARACLTMNGDEGIGAHYEPGQSVTNCIAISSREWAFRLEGSNEWYEFAYLYASRARYGYRLLDLYERSLGTHDIFGDALQYGIMTYNGDPGVSVYRSRFTALRYGHQNDSSNMGLLYSYTKTLSGLPNADAGTGTPQAGAFYTAHFYRTNGSGPMFSVEHNYEVDGIALYGYNWEAYWDTDENAWRFFRRYDNDNNPGMLERIYIPANTEVTVSSRVKMSPAFSGTYPFIGAMDLISGVGENRIGNAGGADSSIWAGKRYTNQYTSASENGYEEKQIVITAKPYPRNYIVGVFSSSATATEGYWVKDLEISFDNPYAINQFNFTNNQMIFNNNSVKFSSDKKIRIGGRFN